MRKRIGGRVVGWGASAMVMVCAAAGCGEGRNVAFENEPEVARAVQPLLLMAVEQAKLFPSKPHPTGRFGLSTAIDGDTAAVGMQRSASPNGNVGAVYLFERSGATWGEVAELKAPGTVVYDEFGDAVALEGDRLAVGTPYIDADLPGAVFSYTRQGGAWSLEGKAVATDGLGSRKFGWNVVLSGNRLAVMDPDSGDVGAAYVFVFQGGTWTQEARLVPSGLGGEDHVSAIGLSGDTLVVAHGSGARAFTRVGSTWSEDAEIPTDIHLRAVALEGDTLALGGQDGCRIFSRVGGDWIQVADPWPPMHLGPDTFGETLALEGDRLLVGSTFSGLQEGGFPLFRAHTFRRSAGVWELESMVLPKEQSKDWQGAFGASVSLSGDTLLIGAPDETTPENEGAAYIFTLVPGLEKGTPCDKPTVCASGFCTDGVCCDTLCEGTCVACVGASKGDGIDGVCGPIAAGTDPDAECAEQAPKTCGTTGMCNGAGACEGPPAGATCDDGNACTEGDVCVGGECAGEPLSCAAPDACHLPGQCNTSTGVCEYALINPRDPECAVVPEASCGCGVPGSGSGMGELSGLMVLALAATAARRARPSRQASQRGTSQASNGS
ncbi:FG-GAP repeat protein [Polyangium sorediatum]|uniref:FG-GAP repeat protein n=1 Tax=Polyangium sorediatum TaxID=889274 RepID=A0ABT6P930_9BACT|nr:FG-GAP repeat protein [Polyangium sorediatum]MDI1437134.1 FG-GAP repeat protein [Polyangium sorediatum]